MGYVKKMKEFAGYIASKAYPGEAYTLREQRSGNKRISAIGLRGLAALAIVAVILLSAIPAGAIVADDGSTAAGWSAPSSPEGTPGLQAGGGISDAPKNSLDTVPTAPESMPSIQLAAKTISKPPSGSLKPMNPAFVKYIKDGHGGSGGLVGGKGLGSAPNPIIIKPQSVKLPKTGSYPASYDLRNYGKVSSVKDQKDAGTCWAFATYGSLESYLLPKQKWDFSENNLKNKAGFDLDPNNGGGNSFMPTAYLTRWSGPVNEVSDPYNPHSTYSKPNLPVQEHVQNVIFIPPRSGPLDNNNIKWALMNYGAARGDFYILNQYYNPTYYAYCDPVTRNTCNHAITIVGWDDNFNRKKFKNVPAGNGAFICKNSWGTGWGNKGYFYISYYDRNLAMLAPVSVFTGEPTTNYAHIYQYDPLGWEDSFGYSSNTAWFANVFTATATEKLKSVGFYTPTFNSPYSIYIYYDGKLTGTTTTGTVLTPGYHTVTLKSSVPIVAGHQFEVLVKLTTPGDNYPVSLEMPINGYSSKATALPGQSYVSYNGQTWTDTTKLYANTNVCLKAYTGK